MVYCSDWQLPAAISKAGALGTLGSGGMKDDEFESNLKALQEALPVESYAVNVPLFHPSSLKRIETIIDKKVPVLITSAGNPASVASTVKASGIYWMHVVSSGRFAKKAQDAGVDAIIAEGFEAGGHNGREETTTLCLIPEVLNSVDLPVIAAGGIALGSQIAACVALGASGVQIGTRFIFSTESSAHQKYKDYLLELPSGSTRLMMKKLMPVRLVDNDFARKVFDLEATGAGKDEMSALLGKGRARKGMKEGLLEEGELEAGQMAGLIKAIEPAASIVESLVEEYHQATNNTKNIWTL